MIGVDESQKSVSRHPLVLGTVVALCSTSVLNLLEPPNAFLLEFISVFVLRLQDWTIVAATILIVIAVVIWPKKVPACLWLEFAGMLGFGFVTLSYVVLLADGGSQFATSVVQSGIFVIAFFWRAAVLLQLLWKINKLSKSLEALDNAMPSHGEAAQ